MNGLQTYQVFPATPEPLKFLERLARNLWWCWHMDAIELFRRINPRLWSQSGRNPILFSTLIPQERLDDLAQDESYLAHLQRVQQKFESQVWDKTQEPLAREKEGLIAYFSMEFGIHESVPLFAGGLGVLAGDHLKAASDRGLPLVGIGLLYRKGYFHQFLNNQGWQQEEYPETDIFHLPVKRAKDPAGQDVRVSIQGPEGDIHAVVWQIWVGRIPLYLLDTNIAENLPPVRDITDRLYAGEGKQRLAQEVLLGIGGMRALRKLGLTPAVCHMNEGHSAFCSLERLCQIKSDLGIDLPTALEIIPRTTVFTTHTPVAAGHDEFATEMVKPYVVPLEECLGVTSDEIIAWGQPSGTAVDTPLSMFVLGLRMSQYHNGVSKLHGQVARRMWAHVWPGWPEDEVPIAHITNGVHIPSWLSVENAHLFERYLGPEWYLHTAENDLAERIDQIYDDELWQAREMSRARLVRVCRGLMVRQYGRRNASQAVMREAETVLDPDILTIGFARRFATYKRATLLLKDLDRIDAILNSKERPVQIIFAGKAHPKDDQGKEIIKQIIEFAQRSKIRHRIVFLEDYDINVARNLVQGVDVWLNTPRRPMEACGTSGMKAAINGVLNVSVLDGWWCEGFSEETGWAIGGGEEYPDHDYQDMVDSQALYNLLENDVIPCFYESKNGRASERWTRMMKASMKMVLQQFCSHLMADRYTKRYYQAAAANYQTITGNAAEQAFQLLKQKQRLQDMWNKIGLKAPVPLQSGPFRVGEAFQIKTEIFLGKLTPEEVRVELYYGSLKSIDALAEGQTQIMEVHKDNGDGNYTYACRLPCEVSGRFGFTVRVTPEGDDHLRFTPGLIAWV
jgi:starch phosphorylase